MDWCRQSWGSWGLSALGYGRRGTSHPIMGSRDPKSRPAPTPKQTVRLCRGRAGAPPQHEVHPVVRGLLLLVRLMQRWGLGAPTQPRCIANRVWWRVWRADRGIPSAAKAHSQDSRGCLSRAFSQKSWTKTLFFFASIAFCSERCQNGVPSPHCRRCHLAVSEYKPTRQASSPGWRRDRSASPDSFLGRALTGGPLELPRRRLEGYKGRDTHLSDRWNVWVRTGVLWQGGAM